MAVINPSLASANPLYLLDAVTCLPESPWLHVDIEDGNFVPNITFGLSTVREIARHAVAPLDAHLLVARPEWLLPGLAELGIRRTAVHYEAVEYPLEVLATIRRLGMRAGLALNFKTNAEALEPFVGGLDYIIVMTAEPDGEGQKFRPGLLDKVARARRLLPAGVEVWVDGGIGEAELPRVVAAGADTVIMGRAVWSAPDPVARYRELSCLARK